MKHAVLLLEGKETASEDTVAKHREYLAGLRGKGLLEASGPFRNTVGGLLIYNVEEFDKAYEIISNDPIVTSGCRTFELYTWANN
ncbi:YciI family protein [Alicyclobacillus dauci]|uniref:YciI family protein n=1 Tax=Alicyclobacillus dauci TaxID=1475485 RepID=A0ABY6YZT7_9BACL|nr:YciI family protein [Alicyclobacillus dauci]WAH35631.1 YciI family protein [Alicyclobacillus dauci]